MALETSQETQVAPDLVGVGKEAIRMRGFAVKAGSKNHTLLLLGETGTGKDQMAELIHFNGRRDEAFVPVDCGTISETLAETELFGYARGAFTGSIGDKPGLVQVAERGTLFFNEIANMSTAMQARLLRLLDGKTFRQVGGTREIKMDTRVIAATNADLEDAVRRGVMRLDLFERLNIIVFNLVPLRERREDIPVLAEYFLKQEGVDSKRLSKGALEAMVGYRWPGNVRELKNVIIRAIFNSEETGEILMEHLELPSSVPTPQTGIKW